MHAENVKEHCATCQQFVDCATALNKSKEKNAEKFNVNNVNRKNTTTPQTEIAAKKHLSANLQASYWPACICVCTCICLWHIAQFVADVWWAIKRASNDCQPARAAYERTTPCHCQASGQVKHLNLCCVVVVIIHAYYM